MNVIGSVDLALYFQQFFQIIFFHVDPNPCIMMDGLSLLGLVCEKEKQLLNEVEEKHHKFEHQYSKTEFHTENASNNHVNLVKRCVEEFKVVLHEFVALEYLSAFIFILLANKSCNFILRLRKKKE